MLVLSGGGEGGLDGGFGGVDARAHHLPLRAGDLPGAQVADLAGAELADAGVADAHAAAEGQRGPGLLTGDEDRDAAVAARLEVGVEELDASSLPLLGVA